MELSFSGTTEEYAVAFPNVSAMLLTRLSEVSQTLAVIGLQQEQLMASVQEIQAKATELASALEETNTSFDALIVSNQEIADALRNLQAAGGASASDLENVLTTLNGALASARTQKAEGDAALVANDITPDVPTTP